MPDIGTMKSSRFLKRDDCGNGILLTIRSCELMNVAPQGTPEEMKWCLMFDETDKPYVSNATNREIIAGFSGQRNSDNWGGVKVVLFNNPAINFNGKMGGISARAPRTPTTARPIPAAAPRTAPAPAPVDDRLPEEPEGDVPF